MECFISITTEDNLQTRGCMNPQYCSRAVECAFGECRRCYVDEPGSPDPQKPWSRCITPDPCVDDYGDSMALECLTCTGANSEQACRTNGNYMTCAPENICYMEINKIGLVRKITKGCMPINDCTVDSLDPHKQEVCRSDSSIDNCLVCDYFQEDPPNAKPWSRCTVLLPHNPCLDAYGDVEDLLCRTCTDEASDEDCRINGVLKRCLSDQICFREENYGPSSVKITRGCINIDECPTRAVSPYPPGLCQKNGEGYNVCFICDYFIEFPANSKPWSDCVIPAPENPCRLENGTLTNLKCLVCSNAPDDDTCKAQGRLEFCDLGDICFKLETKLLSGASLITRGCIPISECSIGSLNEADGVCTEDNGAEICLNCAYFVEEPATGKPWSACDVFIPTSPCVTRTGLLLLDCLSCVNESSDFNCRKNGQYLDCSANDICFRKEERLYGGAVSITRGCIDKNECVVGMYGKDMMCSDNVDGNEECTTCDYFEEPDPVPLDRPWHRCKNPSPCKPNEDLYCLTLNCTAPPGEELDKCEVCPDPGYYQFCGEPGGICNKINTLDKRGVPIALYRGCTNIDECPPYALWKGGPGVCMTSMYGKKNSDCIKCDYFTKEPPRIAGKPWYKCVPRPPPYPCERPDLLQCLTCYNQPTDEDCNINGFFEFCKGVEEAACFRYEMTLSYGQKLISRGCRNRTICGHDALVGEVCSSPPEDPDEERCLMCEFFPHEEPYEEPWWKCQTPEVGVCICTDTKCWPFDVPKQALHPGMHILGQCTFDLIRDDCFQDGPSNLTVLANFEREEDDIQIAHLRELYATYTYPPGPVEVKMLAGPTAIVINKRTGFEQAINMDDLPWMDVTNAPGVELYANSTNMIGEIWALTNSSDIIITKLPNNMLIKWNGAGTFEIELPVGYEGDTCGICGNFDGDPDNEDLCFGLLRKGE